jgi:hypothetical protein
METSMVDVSFMGKNVFIEWMKNERKLPLNLKPDWKSVIDSFCNRHGCGDENSDSSE